MKKPEIVKAYPSFVHHFALVALFIKRRNDEGERTPDVF
jgi:hypothetical protein